jgi:CubicO group peptidase (beta-lactamase class C family)
MRELVFRPAGMSSSGRMTNALKPPRRGRLYHASSPTPELNYDAFYLAYSTGQDMIRFNHALLAGKLISRKSLDTMFAPMVHDGAGDPHSPWRGYEVISRGDTSTSYGGVCESCINGGGEDDEGNRAGFFMPISVSPGAGTLEIEIVNDTAYFTPDADNVLAQFIWKPLYGK